MMYKKSKKRSIIILVIIIVGIIIFNIYNPLNLPRNHLNIPITDTSEKNSELVKNYFVKGMAIDDYKNIFNEKDNYVSRNGNYIPVSYNFDDMHHYGYFEKIFNQLNKSDIVKLEIIGKSFDNRNIYALEIGKGEDVTLFEAGVHASEVANPLFITKFMVDLINRYENKDEEIVNLLSDNKIVILPFANPDGYEIAVFGSEYLKNKNLYINNYDENNSKYFKCNANGVDINRNFPSQTAGLYYNNYDLHSTVVLNKSLASYQYYPGSTLGSEPETKAIMYLQSKWIKNLKSYVTLHSAGRGIFNGKPYLSDEYNENSHKCASIVGDITGYDVYSKYDEDAGKGNDGTSSEYMAESLSGFYFSSQTGRLSSDYYAKKDKEMEYHNTCVIVIESLEKYTFDIDIIKDEYYDYNLSDAYFAIIKRQK